MPENRELTFHDLWLLVRLRWLFILGTMLLFALVALAVGLVSPKVYQAQAIVALPESSRNVITADAKGNVKALVNVAETKGLVVQFWEQLHAGRTDSTMLRVLLPVLKRITVEEIKGSNSQFKLLVQVERDPSAGTAMIETVLRHLRANQYVSRKLEAERQDLEQTVAELQASLERAAAIRDRAMGLLAQKSGIGFNPVESETRIAELRIRYHEVKTNLLLLHTYDLVAPVFVNPSPVKPRVVVGVLMAMAAGLAVGVFIAVLSWSRREG